MTVEANVAKTVDPRNPDRDAPLQTSQTRSPDFSSASCPLPLRDYPAIILGHGGGGKLSSELIEHVFLPAFRNERLEALGDAAVFPVEEGRMAFSTDSYVVQPLFFPGGCIGDLAVNGTVNDLAMSGARPLYLSAGFILEEGFPVARLQQIAERMGAAARHANVQIITGDTKVVERGHGDGCYINTSGVGVIPDGIKIASRRARPGDVVVISGTIGDHGMAIMSVREGLEFEAPIESDSAPLHEMVAAMLQACPDIRALRDPTRGGLAMSLNEIAEASRCGIEIDEPNVPIEPAVASACEILGLDPLLVANEGKLVGIVPAQSVDSVLRAMRSNALGGRSCRIGRVVAEHPGIVIAKTSIGANRIIVSPLGEQLPRIC